MKAVLFSLAAVLALSTSAVFADPPEDGTATQAETTDNSSAEEPSDADDAADVAAPEADASEVQADDAAPEAEEESSDSTGSAEPADPPEETKPQEGGLRA